MVEENEAHYLAELKENGLESSGGRFKIGCFLGTEAANYSEFFKTFLIFFSNFLIIIYLKPVETNISLKLNNSQFYPDSYAMPKEKERFEEGKIERNFDFIILDKHIFRHEKVPKSHVDL